MRIFQTSLIKWIRRGWALAVCGWIGSGAALGQVTNDPPGQFQFISAAFKASEGESTIANPSQDRSIPGALITVTRLKGARGKVLVDYATTTNGTAVAGKDFVAITNGTLTFFDYQMSASFILPIKDNATTNADKTVKMILSNPRPASDEDPTLTPTLGSPTNATLTILDNDSGFNLDRLCYRVNEDAGTITIKVVLPEGGAEGTSVDYQTDIAGSPQPGSDLATADLDFTSARGTLNFGPGISEQTIDLMILQDDDLEFNEDFQVALLNSTAKKSVAVTNLTTETNDMGVVVTNQVVETNDVPLPMGKVSAATITILPVDQSSGGADPEYNPELSKKTSPPYNPTPGANNTVYAVELQPDGKALVGGDFTAVNALTRNRVARLNPDGSLDPSFQIGTGADGYVAALRLRADGKIVIGGGFTSFNGLARYSIARLEEDGALDPTFNPGTSVNGPIRTLALTDQDQVIIGGDFTAIEGISRNSIARLNPDGSLDETFDPGAGANGPIYAIARQADGKLMIGGDFTSINGVSRNAIARLNPDGSVDLSFHPGAGADGAVYALALRELAVTTFSTDSAAGNSSTNLLVTGAPAGTIGVNYNFRFDTNNASTNSLRIYYETNRILDTNIVVSTNSDVSGFVSVAFGPGNANEVTIIVNEGYTNNCTWNYTANLVTGQAGAGKMVVGGTFSSIDLQPRNGIAQLNADGSVDSTYNPGKGANNAVYALAFSPDSQVYLGGAFTSVNGTRRVGLARLLADGTVDTSFLDTAFNQFAGLVSLTTQDPNRFVNAIAVQTNGDLLIGGDFRMLGGNNSTNTIADTTLYQGQPFNFINSRDSVVTRFNFARILGGSAPGPGNVGFSLPSYNVDERAVFASVTVERKNGSLGKVKLVYSTTDGTAKAPADYVPAKDVAFTWAAGDTNQYVQPIGIVDDQQIEGDKTFNLIATLASGDFTLSRLPIPVGVALGRDNAVVTIAEDDFPPSFFAFSAPAYTVDENGVNALITVVRTGGATGRTTVDYATRELTNGVPARAGLDYQSRNGTLTFDSGQTLKTFSIPIIDDTIVEPDESLLLLLTSPRGNGARLGAITNVTLTLIDNDFAPGRLSFTAAAFTAAENSTNAFISVQRAGGTVGAVSAQFLTEDGTGSAGTNYLAVSGTLTWSDGDSAPKTFPVPLLNDDRVEGNKTVHLILTNFAGALPGTMTNSTLTIVDEDAFGRLSLSVTNYLVDEYEGGVTLIVNRMGGAAGAVSVDYATRDGTATNGINYLGVTNTLYLASGQSSTNFTIPILDDNAAGTNRTFTVSLFNPTNAILGRYTNATVTVIDKESNDTPAGQIDTAYNPAAGANNFVYALALQMDGNLVIGGDFTAVNQVTRNRTARLLADGSLDPSFNLGSGANGSVRALALQDDGRPVIGGLFTVVHGTNRNYVARLNTDGSLDASFNPGAGADNPIYAVAIQSDGRVVVGGDFVTFNGVPRNYIARLNTNGVLDLSFSSGAGANGTIYAVAVQSDGKVIIGGNFTTVNNVPQQSFARLNPDGSLDPTFNAGAGADGSVRAVAIQSDGRVVIGGLFTSVNGVEVKRLARLNPDGSLDTTFAVGSGANAAVYAIALQGDQKLVVGGDFTQFNGVTRNRLTRLNQDGSLDPTINFGIGANSFVAAVAIQIDRKIVIGGGFTQFNGVPRNCLARLFGGSIIGPGALEFSSPAFSVNEAATNAFIRVRRIGGTAGTVTVDFGTSDGTALAGLDYQGMSYTLIFPEGETLLAVAIPVLNDDVVEPDETVNIALMNPTGGAVLGPQPTATLTVLDNDSSVGFSSPSFSVSENIATGNATLTVVRRGATNETVTVDYATASGGTALEGQDYRAASGQLTFAPGETAKFFTVPVLDDQLVEGNESVWLALTLPTGSAQLELDAAILTLVDNDFAAGVLRFSNPIYSISEKGTNAVISVTRTNGSTGVVSVNYTTTDGTAQAGNKYLRSSGTLAFADGETSKSFLVPIIDENLVEGDKTVNLILSNATGGAALGSPSTATLLIIDDDFGPGSVDATFDPGAGANYSVRSLALQPDGKLLISGAFTRINNLAYNYVARLNTDGSPDANFRGTGANGLVSAVTLQDNGKVVMGGAFDGIGNASAQKWVGRLNSDGSPDTSFVPPVAINAAVYALQSMRGEKNLIGGAFTTAGSGVARLNANGSLDVSFNAGAGVNVAVFTMATQSDGAVIIGGNFTTVNGVRRNRLARLGADGSLDADFLNASLVAGAGANGVVYVVILQPDGKVILGGDFTQVNGLSRSRIARLNPDGSLDRTFNPGSGLNNRVFALALQPDGKLFVAGDFTSVDGTGRNRIARLNRDGSLDLSFDPGTGADNSVYAIGVQLDGKVVLGGSFSTVNGARRNGIARLLGDAEVKGLITSVTRLPSGEFHLVLNVQPGATYAIQASSNLVDWISLSTHTPTGLTWEFTDTTAPSSGARYYRVVRLDPLLISLKRLDTGEFLLSFKVQPGRSYLLLASSNLVDWLPLSTYTATGPVWNYLDQNIPTPTARYYWAKLLPP